MIHVLIVDDSDTEIAMLKAILEQDKAIKIVGYAKNGAEAVKLVPILKPNLITMDIEMPIMDGLEATRLIMSQFPTPIVVISSKLDDKLLNHTFNALEAGALTVLDKPADITAPSFARTKKYIIDIIHKMAEVKVIKRRTTFIQVNNDAIVGPLPKTKRLKNYDLIAIGASVGGPQALKYILSKLPVNFPVPIVAMQHMTPGFIGGFAQWLAGEISLKVQLAKDKEALQAGTVYFAPDNTHLKIREFNNQLVAVLAGNEPVAGFCPSITELFNSVAHTCKQHALAALLTGMGSDGAHGMLSLKRVGAHTIIQDPESAVVFGMAGVAQSLNAVDKVVELDNIAAYLNEEISKTV